MTLLWPGLPQKSAQGSLRQSLYLLRKHIPEIKVKTSGEIVPFLLADNQSIQVNPEAEVELDVRKFESILKGPVDTWSTAVSLYRGDFLTDFYLPDSAPFEEWVLARREALRRQIIAALNQLAEEALAAANFDTAESYARRQIEIDNLYESGYRLLMRALTLSGKRTEALTLYEDFEQLMEKEFRAKPSTDTADLYAAILAEDPIEDVPLRIEKNTSRHIDLMPSFPISGQAPARPLFVGREEELTRLMGFIEEASHGRGQVAFLVGDAGSGKSSLLTTFADKASRNYDGLLVTRGACNAFSGRGDPYLPFRDILSLLTGDVERAWAAGLLTKEQARNLWQAMPTTIQALSNHGPDLLDTMIPLPPLLDRIKAAFPANQSLLSTLTDRSPSTSHVRDLEQPQIFEQVVALLHHLVKERPLLILLDDLQWADGGSIALLFHLGRRLAGSRILIVGAYRQDEVTAVADHPVRPLLDEFRRAFGDVQLDLNQAPGRTFVDAIIDSETNQLDETFRETLYQQTGGHPLFTVELLSDMQERGDLILDKEGAWITGQSLDWKTLPARVEGVIASRIGRLKRGLREILTVAAVEGGNFTAQVIAKVQGMAVRELVRQLSREADKQHRLVQAQGRLYLGGQQLFQYHFRHNLIQKYLYNNLDEVERSYLHEDVGNALEDLYGEQANEIVVQLAWHFEEAGNVEKAVSYHIRAGHAAKAQFAHEAVIEHYKKAVALLKAQNDFELAAQISMQLGLVQHQVFDFVGAQQAYEEAFASRQKQIEDVHLTALAPTSNSLRTTAEGEPYNLDPTRNTDTTSGIIIGQLFSGLVTETKGMDFEPDVAQSWEILKDGRKYIFHLRSDVTWSDGVSVTAADFEYAWKRVLNPTFGSGVAHILYDVKGASVFHQGQVSNPDVIGVSATDKHTLSVELERPTSYFINLLAHPVTFPVPQHVVELHGETWTEVENIVTNGPFKLETWRKGEVMSLRRNWAYHGLFRGNIERVEVFFSGDDLATEFTWYEASHLDVARLPLVKRETIKKHSEEYITHPTLRTYVLSFDMSSPPFVDKRVRQAFILASDRPGLFDTFTEIYGVPATGGLCPPGMPGHSADIGLTFDPVLARQLLAEAGYPEGRNFPEIEWLMPEFLEPLAGYLQEQWQTNLGISLINKKSVPWGTLSEVAQKEQPALMLQGWVADYPDPDNFLRVFLQQLLPGWQNETFDELVERARSITDLHQRLELYQQADKILIESAALMPLTYGRYPLLVKPWVKQLVYAPHRKVFWQDIIIEPH